MSVIPNVTSASDIQTDFISLLTAQLKYQNPLEPMDSTEMASQLAQLSQLSLTEQMNTSFSDVLATTEMNYANSLLSKKVTFYAEGDEGLEQKKGEVASVFKDPEDDEIMLGINVDNNGEIEEYTLKMDAIVLIENE